jgi:hypothetical protein
MPSSDLILNVRQITGYPPATSASSNDAVVIQRGGLGGPYLSIDAADFVGTALSTGGDMAIGGQLMAPSIQAASVQFSNAAIALLNAQTACIDNLTATWGTIGNLTATAASFASAQAGTLAVSGDMQVGGTANMASAVVQTQLTAGYATVVQTLDAANLNVSNLATVGSLIVDGNFAVPNGTATVGGYPIVTTANAAVSGFAPLDSPAFTGTPTAPTPPTSPTDNSSRLATTAFVVNVVNQLAAGVSAAYATLASPNFSGVPSAPTAAPGSSTAQLATTAFVMAAVASGVAGVSSFNTRTGAVILTSADLSAAGGALLSSPAFTGSPTAPTAVAGTSSGILATTQFVQAAIAALNTGVTTFNTRSGAVTLTAADITGAGGALAASAGVSSFNGRSGAISLTANDVSAAGALVNPSPALSGVPTAPTAAPGVSTTQLATCAFVEAAVAAVATGVVSFNGRSGAVSLTLADVTGVNGAPLNSPSFGGVPLAPAPAPATNTNQIATCAWVLTELGGATIGVTSFNGRGGAVVLTSADITGAGGALAGAGVASFNSRTGAVTLTNNDITAAGGAVLASPAFTGNPTAPTQATATRNTTLANTTFVGAVAAGYLPLSGGTLTGTLNGVNFAASNLVTCAWLQTTGGTSSGGLGSSIALGFTTNAGGGFGGITVAAQSLANAFLMYGYSVTGTGYAPLSMIALAGLTQMNANTLGGSLGFSTFACDQALKSRLTAPSKDALALINDVVVYECDYRHPSATKSEHLDFTVLSDDVRAVMPAAYMEPPEKGYSSLHPLLLIAALWRGVQQLTERVAALEAKVTA